MKIRMIEFAQNIVSSVRIYMESAYVYIHTDRTRSMLLHSIIIGVLVYLFMVFALHQKSVVAANRSILVAVCVLIYMLLFGHGLPTSINKNII